MDLQSWAAFATILAALVTGFALITHNLTKLDSKIDTVPDSLRAEMGEGFTAANRKFAVADAKVDGLRDELGTRIDGLHAELGTRIDGLRDELGARIDGLRDELGTRTDGAREELRTEMRDGFSGVNARLTTLEQRTYDLSTRLPPAPTAQHG